MDIKNVFFFRKYNSDYILSLYQIYKWYNNCNPSRTDTRLSLMLHNQFGVITEWYGTLWLHTVFSMVTGKRNELFASITATAGSSFAEFYVSN